MLKEGRQVLRDPSSLLVAGVLPLILLFLFGYGISLDPRVFRVGLAVEASGETAGSFVAALVDAPLFEVETAPDRRAFEDDLVRGDIRAIIVLPADFVPRAGRGAQAEIQVIADGSQPNTARLITGYLEQLWANWLAQEAIASGRRAQGPAVEPVPQVLFNPELSSRYALVPGSIAVTMTLIGALLTALVVAREWERGTMEALLATPVGIGELILGKLVPYFLLGMASMALSAAFAILVFGMPFRGSFTLLALVSAVFMLCALGQGLLISTLTRSQLVAAQASILSAFLPAFYFSDFVFEIASMPAPLQWVSYAVPARWYVSSLQTLFLSGNVRAVILPDLGALALTAAVLFALTARFTRTRLD
jgi:ABC-2 type transport system permease protein